MFEVDILSSILVWASLSSLLVLSESCNESEALVQVVRNHALGSPVCGEDFVLLHEDSWHLESEEIAVEWNGRLSDLVGFYIEDAGVPAVLAIEATENHDVVLIDLGNTCTLSLREQVGSKVEHLPCLLSVLDVEVLDGVAVSSSHLSNSTEDIDDGVVEGATRVVVSSNVQIGQGKPHIHVDVVLLTSLEGLVLLASGSSDNKELVANITD